MEHNIRREFQILTYLYLTGSVYYSTRWKWVVSFTAWPLYLPGKEPQVHIA